MKKLLVPSISCLIIFGGGYFFCKFFNKPKLIIKKELEFRDVNIKKIFKSDYNKNLQLFKDNSIKIQDNFKDLLNYMQKFHQLVKPLINSMNAIKAGKFISSFFIPGFIDEVLTTIMDGINLINDINNEISIYIQATDKSRINKLMNELDKFKKNPNDLLMASKLKNDILYYTFYMYKLRNSLIQLVNILNSVYKSYVTINEKAKFLLKKIGIDPNKDLIGLKENIKNIQLIISQNKKLIDLNLKIINEIRGIIIGNTEIFTYEEKEKCKVGNKKSCDILNQIIKTKKQGY